MSSEVNEGPKFLKCPFCPCLFLSEVDLARHRQVCAVLRDERMGWRKSAFGDEVCSSGKDLAMVSAIKRNGGPISTGRFEVRLSKNGRWLVRREIMFR